MLNLKDVPYIDSGGLGQLVASYGSVMKTGGAMKLLNVGSRNHDLLSITRLVTVFESFNVEAEAVQSFETARSFGFGAVTDSAPVIAAKAHLRRSSGQR